MLPASPGPKARTSEVWGYAVGEGATSLTMNGIAAFAMLYYTQALGLPFAQAGWAFALASLWDALIDPAIGHLSDNTHTRWGRRHPFMYFAGAPAALAFYFLWSRHHSALNPGAVTEVDLAGVEIIQPPKDVP